MGAAVSIDYVVPESLRAFGDAVKARAKISKEQAAYSRDYVARMKTISRDGKPWTPQEDALLGTDTDRVIAEKLGRSTVSVGNRRTKLGISRRAVSA